MTIGNLALEGPVQMAGKSDLGWMSEYLKPVGQAILLSASYGIALGIGAFGGHVLGCALTIPATLAVALLVALPSLFVILSMLEAPVSIAGLVMASLQAYRHAALALGGFAPTLLLLATSIDDKWIVYHFAVVGLLLAGHLGAYRLTSEVGLSLTKGLRMAQIRQWATLLGFVWLAFELAARFWGFALSLIGGAP
jgi:hypothetical protein